MSGWLGEDKNWFIQEARKPATPQRAEKNKAVSNYVPSVDYVTVKCPVCKSKKCPVHTSDPPIRYHRCENGHSFKSIEK